MRFVFLETLSPDDGDLRLLTAASAFMRPPPVALADASEGGVAHELDRPREIALASTSVLTLAPGARVVSSYAVETAAGGVMLPRGDRSLVDGYRLAARLGGSLAEDLVSVATGIDWTPGVERVQPRPTLALDGDVFWVGPDERDNWGVWLVQALPALAWAEAEGLQGPLLCHALTPWQHALIALAAPSLSGRLTPQDQWSAYRIGGRLTCLAQDRRNLALTGFERDALAQVRDRLVPRATGPGPERIFVSRLAQVRRHPDYRVLRNEQALIDALAQEGVVAVQPETLSIPDQAALFAGARQVVGLGGAGLFSTVFCKPGTPVLTVESSAGWIEAHATLFAGAGLPYAVVFGRREAETSHAAWTVDVDAVVRLVRQAAP